MFDPQSDPRIFALPSGVDFPKALVQGLIDRTVGQPPQALARVELVVNTRRMERRIRALFDQGPALLLPRLSLLTDLGETKGYDSLPPAIPPLRRRLELTQLVARLLDQQPDLAARASLFDLSDSLAGLIDEMQGEGVPAQAIRDLDVSDQSGHWERAQKFVGIAESFVDPGDDNLDAQARQRRVVEALIDRWVVAPPSHPVILAGSTGSRGTTLMLMEAVAKLPQGAVILPGFDFDMPTHVWESLTEALSSEDHPQYRFAKLARNLEMSPGDIRPWTRATAPSPDRNRLVSLALRPAPVTDAWMAEGPELSGLETATADMTLVEAPTPRAEALAIALRLRKAAEDGQTAALITPDRMLTRQVSAALDRWDIIADDSAGLPLHLSPPGRFLRHVAELFTTRLTSEALLTLLKHPLCHSGAGRGDHLRHARDLELDVRRNGPPFPEAEGLAKFAARQDNPPDGWLGWIGAQFCDQQITGERALTDWVTRLRIVAEAIAAGSAADGSGVLWDQNAGQKALAVMDRLADEAHHGGNMTARDFADLLGALLSAEEVRDRDAPISGIMIWGTLEARVQGADLMILGGLNEGSWPEAARPDPWLNRHMRDAVGLLLPERRIGLSAHDFQQAIGAPNVWLTRSVRSDDAETVASRWLNRLTNLLDGLPDQGGRTALTEMRARGQIWLDWAETLEEATPLPAAPRPSPRPPVEARPRRLSVTEIKRLIRDPYAIYAKHVLKLRALDPLVQSADALLRGNVIHDLLEEFIRATLDGTASLSVDDFLRHAEIALEEQVPWPTARRLWYARLSKIAPDFIAAEITRRSRSTPEAFERRARMQLDDPAFEIVGVADRVDRDSDGSLRIFDYKTGTPPTTDQQKQFDKQLLIEAAMAEQGDFDRIGPAPVVEAAFLGVGAAYKEVPAPITDERPEEVLENLRKLLSDYLDREQGFTSRRMLHKDTDIGDFDHLARFGEWDRSTDPTPEDLS